MGTPIGDPLTVPNSLLFSEASTRARVVLNGEGGDPCFGGPKNLPMVLALLYGEQDRERLYLRLHRKCFEDLAVMLRPDVAASIPPAALEDELRPYLVDPRWTTLVNRLMAMNVTLKGASHILAKVDQESAAYGLLPRSPLFDRSVVELACALPPQDKLRGSVEKYLLKQAVADLVPAEIVVRPKSGMRVPVEAWFAGPLLRPAKSRLLDGLAPWDLFQPGYLRNLIDVKAGGYRQRRGVKIWLLLTLESWLRTVLAPGPVGPDLRPAALHAGT